MQFDINNINHIQTSVLHDFTEHLKINDPRSLISALVVRSLDSVMSLVSSLVLASVVAQWGLCMAWSETPEDTFCRVVTQ